MTGVKLCPICAKPAVAAWAPFCSKRCADVDLARWLGEKYALPAEDDSDDSVLADVSLCDKPNEGEP